MGFYPAGTRLIEAGKPSEHVFVLCKGHVHALDPVAGGERRFADYAAGDVFGSFAVIAGRARHSYVAGEDLLCFLIPAAVFQHLLTDNPRFAAYLNDGMSAKRQLAAEQQGSELNQLMLTRVRDAQLAPLAQVAGRSEEHTSELQSLMRISYAVLCLKKKKKEINKHNITT